MKVGDLVKNGQGSVGIVYGIGYGGRCRSKDKCPFPNPDIHVYASSGYAIWSYNALEVISEVRDNMIENFGRENDTSELLFRLEEVCDIMIEHYEEEK